MDNDVLASDTLTQEKNIDLVNNESLIEFEEVFDEFDIGEDKIYSAVIGENIHDDDVTDEMFETPSEVTYWIPQVEDQFKIGLGSVYANVDAAEAAYMKYAEEGGQG